MHVAAAPEREADGEGGSAHSPRGRWKMAVRVTTPDARCPDAGTQPQQGLLASVFAGAEACAVVVMVQKWTELWWALMMMLL